MFSLVGQAGAHGSRRGRSLVLWAMLSVQNKNEKSFKSLIIIQKSEVRQILSEATAAN